MTGNEDIKVNDKLLCTSNEGLMSVGSTKTIKGLTDISINFSDCLTSWEARSSVRWGHYRHVPKVEEGSE